MDDEWEKILGQQMDDSFFDQAPPQSDEYHTKWSREESRQFENALVEFNHSSPTLFENLASRVPFKSIEDVKNHYQALKEDVDMIDAGLIEPPEYKDAQCVLKAAENGQWPSSDQQIRTGTRHKKRRIAWTNEEHGLFLKGLDKFGKGDWRSISRFCVPTKTPTQVASHAQKYFRRLQKSSTPAGKSRHSINDIQNVTSSTTITVSVPKTDQNRPLPLPNSFPHNNMTFSSSITTTTTNAATISIPPFNPAMTTMMQSSSSSSASTLGKWFWSD